MRRIKLKKNKQHKKMGKVNLLIISFILVVICVVFIFQYINKKASPIIMSYAEMEAKKLSSIIGH